MEKFLSSFLYLLTRSLTILILVVQVYELITCVQRANENAGNVISVGQFLINKYIYIYRRVDICRTAHRVLNSRLELSRCVKQINSISDLSFYY